MGSKRFTFLLFSLAALCLAILSSCQKDPSVNNSAAPALTADSSVVASPGNALAVTGILKIKFNDSIYTFDAARDSIAFINVHCDGDTRYFGITAINKEHTMSFGISSAGFAYSNITRDIAGSQFLLNNDKKPVRQLSLSKFASPKDFGSVSIQQYKAGSELAKGTFYTFLAADDKAASPWYRVEGTFDLQLK